MLELAKSNEVENKPTNVEINKVKNSEAKNKRILIVKLNGKEKTIRIY